jgi:LDH2 family malate/lactate/ureidoglycolate dehydrogenase
MQADVRVNPDRLIAFATSIYRSVGMCEEDAHVAADSLVQADLWGHQSHGVMRLSWYAARLKAGVCDPVATPETIMDGGALALIDGREAMGQVLAKHAAEDAIRRAKAHGIGAVAVRNSNHFGTAMYFTLMAARAGCLGFLCTNASPAMSPWGGRKKVVGNNPWSWACPGGSHAPFVLDIANTSVARGKIYLARQKGLPIPKGWAVNRQGYPTTDPAEALEGILLPMAEHKGYAISVMMDVISGVLTGSSFATGVAGPYQAERRSGSGHFFIAIDIAAFQPLDEFAGRIDMLVRELKGVPRAPDFEEVFYPGEIESRNDVRNRAEGLLLPDDTLDDLSKLATEFGLPDVPFDRPAR